MQLRIKRLRDVPMPKYQTDGAAGIDLAYWPVHQGYPATTSRDVPAKLPTGISMEIPDGHVGLLLPRSSLREKLSYFHPGVIDPDFRGEVQLCFTPCRSWTIEAGERIAQLVIVPCPRFDIVEAEELSETTRGSGGFGSTGR